MLEAGYKLDTASLHISGGGHLTPVRVDKSVLDSMAQKVQSTLRTTAGPQIVRMASLPPEITTQEDRCRLHCILTPSLPSSTHQDLSHTILNTILTLLIRHHPGMLDHDLVRIPLVLHVREPLQSLHTPGQTAVRPGTIALQSLVHLDTVLIGVRHSYWDVVGRMWWNTNPF